MPIILDKPCPDYIEGDNETKSKLDYIESKISIIRVKYDGNFLLRQK